MTPCSEEVVGAISVAHPDTRAGRATPGRLRAAPDSGGGPGDGGRRRLLAGQSGDAARRYGHPQSAAHEADARRYGDDWPGDTHINTMADGDPRGADDTLSALYAGAE